ncbi:putative Tubulin-specific chaperone D [Blattamonas nauphoetae]|uniref:Tubulin-specific chaperone D n=1 Tax=Blattamonas nauphoetae TaxID=2049346 RepID=A0ABQ9Y444_9EUKA|nr:putative Tubulin-specific chaperone D [Blattamonas nauphoetae]
MWQDSFTLTFVATGGPISLSEQYENFPEPLSTIIRVWIMHQEQASILDPILDKLCSLLIVPTRKAIVSFVKSSNSIDVIQSNPTTSNIWNKVIYSLRTLYVLSNCRGFKIIVKFFSHPEGDLLPVLKFIENFSTSFSTIPTEQIDNAIGQQQILLSQENVSRWQCRYVLLLWLSHAIQLPLNLKLPTPEAPEEQPDFSLILSTTTPIKGDPRLAGRICRVAVAALDDSSIARSMAVVALSRFFSRVEMQGTPLTTLIKAIITELYRLDELFEKQIINQSNLEEKSLTCLELLARLTVYAHREGLRESSMFVLSHLLYWQTTAKPTQIPPATIESFTFPTLFTVESARHKEDFPAIHLSRVPHVFVNSSNLLRKMVTKCISAFALVDLPPIPADWRYQKGCRSLDLEVPEDEEDEGKEEEGEKKDGGAQKPIMEYTEIEPQPIAPISTSSAELAESTQLSLTSLLTQLGDSDTIVRVCAAKGVGRIVSRIPSAQQASQIVKELLSKLNGPSQSDSTTNAPNTRSDVHSAHGSCLAIAQIIQRASLQPDLLPETFQALFSSLRYEHTLRNSSSSSTVVVGVAVRDAACFALWSSARTFAPALFLPFAQELGTQLIHVALFDLDINCRRAAAATFQECIGRLGVFQTGTNDDDFTEIIPHGLDILQIVDFFSVGSLASSYTILAYRVSEFVEYRESIVRYLLQTRAGHWNSVIRSLAARALGVISQLDRPFFVTKILPQILTRLKETSSSLEKHGLILSLSEIMNGISMPGTNTYAACVLKQQREQREAQNAERSYSIKHAPTEEEMDRMIAEEFRNSPFVETRSNTLFYTHLKAQILTASTSFITTPGRNKLSPTGLESVPFVLSDDPSVARITIPEIGLTVPSWTEIKLQLETANDPQNQDSLSSLFALPFKLYVNCIPSADETNTQTLCCILRLIGTILISVGFEALPFELLFNYVLLMLDILTLSFSFRVVVDDAAIGQIVIDPLTNKPSHMKKELNALEMRRRKTNLITFSQTPQSIQVQFECASLLGLVLNFLHKASPSTQIGALCSSVSTFLTSSIIDFTPIDEQTTSLQSAIPAQIRLGKGLSSPIKALAAKRPTENLQQNNSLVRGCLVSLFFTPLGTVIGESQPNKPIMLENEPLLVKLRQIGLLKKFGEGCGLGEDDAVLRSIALQSSGILLGKIVQNDPSTLIQPNIEWIFSQFESGCNDYTKVKGGDMGSLVRRASMISLSRVIFSVLKESPDFFTQPLIVRTLRLLSKQLLETIDNVRLTAGPLLSSLVFLLHNIQPNNSLLTRLASLLNVYAQATQHDDTPIAEGETQDDDEDDDEMDEEGNPFVQLTRLSQTITLRNQTIGPDESGLAQFVSNGPWIDVDWLRIETLMDSFVHLLSFEELRTESMLGLLMSVGIAAPTSSSLSAPQNAFKSYILLILKETLGKPAKESPISSLHTSITKIQKSMDASVLLTTLDTLMRTHRANERIFMPLCSTIHFALSVFPFDLMDVSMFPADFNTTMRSFTITLSSCLISKNMLKSADPANSIIWLGNIKRATSMVGVLAQCCRFRVSLPISIQMLIETLTHSFPNIRRESSSLIAAFVLQLVHTKSPAIHGNPQSVLVKLNTIEFDQEISDDFLQVQNELKTLFQVSENYIPEVISCLAETSS